MYHAIVRARITRLFHALNQGNYEPVLGTLAGQFEHWFAGEHALSGTRTTMARTRAWYERLYKVFPNIRFDLSNIVVNGPPWNTTVAVEWNDSYTLANGDKRSNCGVHFIRLQWGRGTSVRIYCDTRLLLENLEIQYRGGVPEAHAAPITG
jgi:ketosteroid isomerase-like protein